VKSLPSLDLHAHVDTGIEACELIALESAVFAVTRSLDEARQALHRDDRLTVWGVGCHPGLARSQKTFSAAAFADLLDRTALAGELGLDGRSRVTMDLQRTTFLAALNVLREKPRITTIHSYAATRDVLELLSEITPLGTVLHWWLGTPEETARALALGCHFSVNAAMLNRRDWMRQIPLDRILTETDHPFGDRTNGRHRRPGFVANVESALGAEHGLSASEVRFQVWRNLRTLTLDTSVGSLLPSELRKRLASV
jgi:TatD DNase family protein